MKGLLFKKLKTGMIQKKKKKFTLNFLLTDFIKEHGDLCLKCRRKTENLDSKIFKTKNGILLNAELKSQNL